MGKNSLPIENLSTASSDAIAQSILRARGLKTIIKSNNQNSKKQYKIDSQIEIPISAIITSSNQLTSTSKMVSISSERDLEAQTDSWSQNQSKPQHPPMRLKSLSQLIDESAFSSPHLGFGFDSGPLTPSSSAALQRAIQGRIQLASKCIIIMTKIIKQSKIEQSQTLMRQLSASVKHADVTLAELKQFYSQFETQSSHQNVNPHTLSQIRSDYQSVVVRGDAICRLAHNKLSVYESTYSSYQNENISDERQQLLQTQIQTTVLPTSPEKSTLQNISKSSSIMNEIESDIVSIHSLFLDLHHMVHSQQHYFDSIESEINDSYNKVTQGEHEIEIAKKYQIRRRKRVCCFIMFLTLLLGCLVLALYIATP